MNNYFKVLTVLSVTIGMSGCVTREQRMQQSISSSTKACVSMGFKYGTPELSSCVQNMVSADMDDYARRKAAIGALGRSMMSTRPTSTTINCSSIRTGNIVNTNCY